MQTKSVQFNSSNIYPLIEQPSGQLRTDVNKNSEQYKSWDKNEGRKQSITLN